MQDLKVTDTIQGKVSAAQKRIVWQDFNLTLLGALILFLLVSFGGSILLLQPLRIILGLIYVLFVPGYWLTTALYPRVHDLTPVERLGLSIGFSVAAVPVLALILDRMEWGLFLWPILIIEFGMTGFFTALASLRRWLLSVEVVYVPRIEWQPWWNSQSTSRRRLYKALMVGLLLVAAWILLTPAHNQTATEFYILGSEGSVGYYPYQVGRNDEVRVNIGVINRETRELNFHFEIWVTDSLNPNRRERVVKSDSFSLKRGEKYEDSIYWYMPWVGEDQIVELLLFYNDDSVPSRQLRMWINVQE